ncbi:hypothetical protein SNEBB_004454 [Seison nebaliae]|nr:hypothetical protein SNEBB_004454 [Seison nebaliae]
MFKFIFILFYLTITLQERINNNEKLYRPTKLYDPIDSKNLVFSVKQYLRRKKHRPFAQYRLYPIRRNDKQYNLPIITTSSSSSSSSSSSTTSLPHVIKFDDFDIFQRKNRRKVIRYEKQQINNTNSPRSSRQYGNKDYVSYVDYYNKLRQEELKKRREQQLKKQREEELKKGRENALKKLEDLRRYRVQYQRQFDAYHHRHSNKAAGKIPGDYSESIMRREVIQFFSF